MTPDCVYCLDNALLVPSQVLLRGANLYLCAPRGQLTEGFLAVAPYRCIGCLAMLPPEWYAELEEIERVVASFYADSYGGAGATFYEQGRAGGGATAEQAGGFPLHAHLCCLPLAPDLDSLLHRYRHARISGWSELPTAAEGGPYVYVSSGGVRSVYVARRAEDRAHLARLRLKPEIAALMGVPERGYWRDYPGDEELELLVAKFARWHTTPPHPSPLPQGERGLAAQAEGKILRSGRDLQEQDPLSLDGRGQG